MWYVQSLQTYLTSSEEIANLNTTKIQIMVSPSVPARLFVLYKNFPYAEIVHMVQ